MSNEKLSALVERTTPALADLLYDVPVGAPIGNRITLGNLLANAPSVTFANPHTFPSISLTSPLTPTNGGTGIANNNASTLAISGNFAMTLTVTGATNVTLPTSGTLLTSAGAVTSIAGTANQITASAAIGAVTLSLPNAVAINLGSVTPPTPFVVGDTSASTPRGLMSWQSSNDTGSAHLHMRKSRGTFAVPLTVAVADILGRVVYSGYDGASYLEMASIRATVVGTVAATRIPTKIELMTGTDAAPSVLTVALTLDQNQTATFAGAIIGTATQSLLNTVSTTVNFAGAATVVSVGAATVAFSIGGTDVKLNRDAANALAQRNGTTAQVLRVYGTFTDASNYERFTITTAGGAGGDMTIGSERLGTGAAGSFFIKSTSDMRLQTNGSTRWAIQSTGHLWAGVDNTYDIGAAGATRPRTAYIGTSIITPAINNGATGLLVGSATTDKIGHYGVAAVIQPASANQAALTDSTTGTPAFTLVDAGVVFSQANINNNFASLNRQVDAFRTALVNLGLVKGAA